jgi:hypothetical protein
MSEKPSPIESSHTGPEASQAHDSSSALLADAQKFSLELALHGMGRPTGGYTNNSDVMRLPDIVNDKLNQVNNLSPADRATWLKDFRQANSQAEYSKDPYELGESAPVKLDISTGRDGKAADFQITTNNWDAGTPSSPATAVLDGTVGANGPANVQFDAAKTQAQFVSNENTGFESLHPKDGTNRPLTATQVETWAAEAQAMPPSYRAAMIAEAKRTMPTVGWNLDSQGQISSIDFAGQQLLPSQWSQALQADTKVYTAGDETLTARDLQTLHAPPDTDGGGYDSGGGGGGGGGRSSRSSGSTSSDGRSSYPGNGTVVQGVGADPGLYISNGDGTVSKW